MRSSLEEMMYWFDRWKKSMLYLCAWQKAMERFSELVDR
jgi:hypothetical protein